MDPTATDRGDARRAVVAARLARVGFDEPEIASLRLTTPPLIAWSDQDDPVEAFAPLVSALGRAADPDLALSYVAQLVCGQHGESLMAELLSSAEFRARLLGVLGSSTALAEHLLAQPQDALLLRGTVTDLPSVADAQARLLAAVGASGPDECATLTGELAATALRTAYRRELVLVAGRDLAGEWDLLQVSEALADLAGFTLQAGLTVARSQLPAEALPCRLAVVAMGKTGGRELNYVSDVDVVFVAEPARDGDSVEAALATATKLASGMMTLCGQAAWEVDAALRPEGKSGALVRTLASHEAYYRRWASTWEFQALLKARPIAGDAELGQAYLDAIMPMVWVAAERPDFVSDVQAMRRRVVDHLPKAVLDRELKLGPGGLRDVEFAVQLLQLVHGRSDDTLRHGATLPALAALRDGGYVGRDDAVSLADAYIFLRTTEHRVQLLRLRRTHLVPDDETVLLHLARSMGFRADSRGDAAAVWRDEWALHVREVRRLHEKLFYRPLLEAVARVPSEALRLSTTEARRRLEALGYRDPAGALRHIEALTAGVTRRASIQRALLPVILAELAAAADPDAGLLGYRQVSDALGATPWFLRLLRDESAVTSRLSYLLGTSRYVSHMLVRAPEALQFLADDGQLVPHRRVEIESTMATAARRQQSPSDAAHVIRSLRRIELLRIAFAQLLGRLDDSAGRIALTELADATLSATVQAAQRAVAAEQAVPDLDVDLAVIAMGRLGGQELGYGSDADVLFVYRRRSEEITESEAGQRARAIAERMRAMLASPSTDPPLTLDANLRPEGRDGPLVRSLASYAEYYARWASVWEAQALLRARACAGDADLAERFIQLIGPLRYPEGGLSDAGTLEIRRIKGRVDAERLPRGADPHTHTKLGRGGLADIEWTVQLLQLRHADSVPGLRSPATLSALWAAASAGLIGQDDAASLEATWRLASRLRDAIMLVRDRAEDQLPAPGLDLAGIARVMGYPPGADPGQMVDDYRRATRRARSVVERLFYDSPV